MRTENEVPPASSTCDPATGCCSDNTGPETRVTRRDFIRAMGLASAGVMVAPSLDFLDSPVAFRIPEDKGLSPAWLRSLFERGEPEVHTGRDLVYIGMPVGGIGAGQVYLGGDGKLWLWDIFNRHKEGVESKTVFLEGQTVRPRDGSNFVAPVDPAYPFEQGFGLALNGVFRKLDYAGFADIRFSGQYPVGTATYRDAECPVGVVLEAFSPFVPLDLEASSYPATVMAFTLENTSGETVDGSLSGWLENPVCRYTGSAADTVRVNRVRRDGPVPMLVCTAEQANPEAAGKAVTRIDQQTDFGSMALAVVSPGGPVQGTARTDLLLQFDENLDEAREIFGRPLMGALRVPFRLAPGERRTISFIIAWHFPNLELRTNRTDAQRLDGRYYGTRWADAAVVAGDLTARFESLRARTLRWRDIYYNESSLPHWFLNRTMWNVSTLATETCYRLAEGRFWAWEGIGCCEGTCTHVWHYAQAHARLFPEIERILREKTDFVPPAFDAETGVVHYRGNYGGEWAVDGQAGTILRSYRDYLTSPDDAFLRRHWPSIRKATEWLIRQDAGTGTPDGILEGEQPNTLDAAWYGKIPAMSTLYLAALAAAAEMARHAGDESFADACAGIAALGRKNIQELFNGEYFIQIEDPAHLDAIGVGIGCHIDQVIGQGWALQLGLGRVVDEESTRRALASLWKYNFVPDVGPLRASLPPGLRGRPYALAGDAGLLMATWPKGGKRTDWEKHWQYGYFNECMTGFEHQAAAHMIGEGMVEEGLAVVRAIHDRYHPSKRNPYNEVECSDHYARAMASYGAYLAACGFHYDGPAGLLAFAPRLNPGDFRAAFTAAEGWGLFAQSKEGHAQKVHLRIDSGRLLLATLRLAPLEGVRRRRALVARKGQRIPARLDRADGHLAVVFDEPLVLETGEMLDIQID